MAVRPPRLLAPRRQSSPVEAMLDEETRAEKAGTLGRLMHRLERALDRHARAEENPEASPERRERLAGEAAEALWHVVIQRELMGLSNTQRFLKDLGVSRELVLMMGVRRPPPGEG